MSWWLWLWIVSSPIPIDFPLSRLWCWFVLGLQPFPLFSCMAGRLEVLLDCTFALWGFLRIDKKEYWEIIIQWRVPGFYISRFFRKYGVVFVGGLRTVSGFIVVIVIACWVWHSWVRVILGIIGDYWLVIGFIFMMVMMNNS